MAKITLNSAIRGISGALDNWVYKRFGNGVSVGRRGIPSGPPSANQLAQREQFRAAASYAKTAIADPAQRVAYDHVAKERGTGIRNFALAVGDFFNSPQVTAIDLAGYHGHVGDHIAVVATDDVGVVSVTVKVRDNTTAMVLEQGPAGLLDGKWRYTATAALPAGHTATIEATALDRPGNTGDRSVAFP